MSDDMMFGPFIYRLVRIPSEMEIPARTLPVTDEYGRRAGIQEFVGPVPVMASSRCPICYEGTPHSHGQPELDALRSMETYLSSKLGIESLAARVEALEKLVDEAIGPISERSGERWQQWMETAESLLTAKPGDPA